VLVVSAQRAMGIAPESGKLLWEFPWSTQFDINVAQPVVIGDNRVFLSAGYGHGGALLELSKTDSGLALKNLWSTNRMKNKFTTSVLHEGYLYGLDEAILACIDAQTGELKWKGGRYGYGEVALASGHLIVTTESGEVVLVKATPESFQEISRFQAVSGKTWNHPALADGMLLVRNETEMACFRIGAK
jgi:outer membrane protein assembly factor BamB